MAVEIGMYYVKKPFDADHFVFFVLVIHVSITYTLILAENKLIAK